MCVKPSMLDGLKNGFAILQVKMGCQKMFLSLEALGNEVPDIRNYDVVYKADRSVLALTLKVFSM